MPNPTSHYQESVLNGYLTTSKYFRQPCWRRHVARRICNPSPISDYHVHADKLQADMLAAKLLELSYSQILSNSCAFPNKTSYSKNLWDCLWNSLRGLWKQWPCARNPSTMHLRYIPLDDDSCKHVASYGRLASARSCRSLNCYAWLMDREKSREDQSTCVRQDVLAHNSHLHMRLKLGYPCLEDGVLDFDLELSGFTLPPHLFCRARGPSKHFRDAMLADVCCEVFWWKSIWDLKALVGHIWWNFAVRLFDQPGIDNVSARCLVFFLSWSPSLAADNLSSLRWAYKLLGSQKFSLKLSPLSVGFPQRRPLNWIERPQFTKSPGLWFISHPACFCTIKGKH